MTGGMLGAEAAAGAKMNKGKIVKIAAVSVLAMLLLLTAAAVCMARCGATDQLRAIFGNRDSFLMVCVVTHLVGICLLSWYAAIAPTPESRRSHARATVASCVQLAANLYLALAARAKDQDAASA